MQVINSRLVSNPWPSSRTENNLNRQKPSNKLVPSLHFYEFEYTTSQTHELTVLESKKNACKL